VQCTEQVHADEQQIEGTRLGVCFSQHRFSAVNRNQETTLTVELQRTLNIAVFCPTDQQILAAGLFFQKFGNITTINLKPIFSNSII
jgi:hypothetical protein